MVRKLYHVSRKYLGKRLTLRAKEVDDQPGVGVSFSPTLLGALNGAFGAPGDGNRTWYIYSPVGGQRFYKALVGDYNITGEVRSRSDVPVWYVGKIRAQIGAPFIHGKGWTIAYKAL